MDMDNCMVIAGVGVEEVEKCAGGINGNGWTLDLCGEHTMWYR